MHEDKLARRRQAYARWKINNPDYYQQPKVKERLAKNRKAFYARKIVAGKPHHLRHGPIYYLVCHAKARATKLNLEFDLDWKAMSIPERCPVLDIPIFTGAGKQTDNSPSIDRIDNTKGYTKDNVAIISLKANRMKNNCSLDELNRMVTWLTNITTLKD